MYLDKNTDTKWLIKSENKILGPYNYEQIVDLIRKKQISLIDEIRDPDTRWLYVRENTEFKSIVEERRKEIDSGAENTKTYQSFSKTVEDEILKTKTDINLFTDISIEAKDIAVVNEILTAHDETVVRQVETSVTNKAKLYGVQTDPVVKANVSQYFNKVLFLSIAVVASAAISFFGYMYVQKKNVIKQEEELVRQIKKNKFLGFYQKAADIFSQLPVATQKKLMPELLELYPALEAQGLVNLDDVELVKSGSILLSEQKANIELIYFRAAMQKNNFGDAQDYLVKATTFLPASYLIKENEALLSLKKGQFMEAFNMFNNIFKQEKNGRYLLGMVQSFFGLSNFERTKYGKELLQNIEKYTTVYYDYKKELLLAQLALSYEFNEVVLYNVSKTQFFNTPCRLSEEFGKSSLLVPNSYLWIEIKEVSAGVQKNLSGDELLLFQLHDYLESNQMSAAAEFLSNNQSKVNSSAIRSQMNLLLLDAQKRNNEVVALEKSNKLDMNSEMNHFLLAKNKIELNTGSSIATHLQFLNVRQHYFYRDWLELEQLIKKNSIAEIKTFLNDHFVTVQNFNPVFVAKSLVY